MSISSSGVKVKECIAFEKQICEELLDISRIIYVEEAPNKHFPTAAEVVKRKNSVGPREVQKEIQDNIDFLRMTVKYVLLDRDALLREIKKKGK